MDLNESITGRMTANKGYGVAHNQRLKFNYRPRLQGFVRCRARTHNETDSPAAHFGQPQGHDPAALYEILLRTITQPSIA